MLVSATQGSGCVQFSRVRSFASAKSGATTTISDADVRRSRNMLVAATALVAGIVVFVHWNQENERKRMKVAVEQDRAAEREELRKAAAQANENEKQ